MKEIQLRRYSRLDRYGENLKRHPEEMYQDELITRSSKDYDPYGYISDMEKGISSDGEMVLEFDWETDE